MQVALAQMKVEGGQPERNRARACRRIEQAASLGVDLVLLPEALDFGWTHPSAQDAAGAIPGGETFETLSQAAKKNGLFVCAGLVELHGKHLFNSAVLIGREGELLLHHRKINELEIAHDLYSLGSEANAACDTELAPIGLQVCADGFADGQWISRRLCDLGARIILMPCAWAVDSDFDPAEEPYGKIWRENLGLVARERSVWILACSNVGPITAGPWRGRKCIGNSLVFDPDGNEVLVGPFGEGAEDLLLIDI